MTTLQQEMVLYRAKHDINLREMAKRCKLSLQTVHSIESGIQTPSRLTEAKIRLVLDAEEEEANNAAECVEDQALQGVPKSV